MVSRDSIFPLPHNEASSAHINGNHDYDTSLIIKKMHSVEWARKFAFDAMSSPNIPGLEDIPLPDSQIGALKPPYPVRLYIRLLSKQLRLQASN